MDGENSGTVASGATYGAPTRERVSEAIAMIRARQQAASKLADPSESSITQTPTATITQPARRSPLLPAGQSMASLPERKALPREAPSTPKHQQLQRNNNNFLMNVFASRSDVDTTPIVVEPMQDDTFYDCAEENVSQPAMPTFMNPLELVKREMQFATQSFASSGVKSSSKPKPSYSSKRAVAYSVTSIASDDSSEAEEPVDEQTMRDVAMYLDKLNGKPSVEEDQESVESESAQPVDAATIQKVENYLDMLDFQSKATADETNHDDDNDDVSEEDEEESVNNVDPTLLKEVDSFIQKLQSREVLVVSGSGEISNDDSSNSSVHSMLDHQTLADLGAYIDTVSQVGGVSREMQMPASESFWQSLVANTLEAERLENRVSIDESVQGKPFDEKHTDDARLELPTRSSEDASAVDDELTLPVQGPKVSPIYEQLEAMELPRGAHVDPPAVLTSHNIDQVDPPAPSPKNNINEAVMRLHGNSEVVVPSYSIESLESGPLIPPAFREDLAEEKKDDDDDDVDNEVILERPGASHCSESSNMEHEVVDSTKGSIASLAQSVPPTPSAQSQSGASINSEVVDNAGVPLRCQLSAEESVVDEEERYDVVESEMSNEETEETAKEGKYAMEEGDSVSELPKIFGHDLPSSPSMKDDTSIETWELKDIASEETIKAAGRTRMTDMNPNGRSKARKLASIMSDDSSVPNTKVDGLVLKSEGEGVELSFEKEDVMTSESLTNRTSEFEPAFEQGVASLHVMSDENAFLPSFDVKDFACSTDEENAVDLSFEHGDSGVEVLGVDPDDRQEDTALTTEENEQEDFIEEFLRQGSIGMSADITEEGNEGKIDDLNEDQHNASSLDKYEIGPLSATSVSEAENIGFLQQFASLEMDADDESVSGEVEKEESNRGDEAQESTVPPAQKFNLFTLPGIALYFATLDEHLSAENAEMEHNVKFFQKLVGPVVSGETPSIIEAAQIRQAAFRADIPIEVVDRFLDFVNEDEASVIQDDENSTRDGSTVTSKFDNMEELDEDEAITAFLKRFGTLHKGGHFPEGNAEAVQDYIENDVGGGEVEIDAEYGFVNKELSIKESATAEEEGGWWNSVLEVERKLNAVVTESKSHEESGIATNGSDECDTAQSSPLQRKLNRHGNQRLVVSTHYARGDFESDRDFVFNRRYEMATFGGHKWLSPTANSRLSKPQEINGVAAADNIRKFIFSKSIFKNHRPWRRLYRERTQQHPGFKNIDLYSIYDSTMIELYPEEEEEYIPWEHRKVQQRFLQEKSFSFSRNWFGNVVRKRGNDKIKAPVCKPKSMEMPMEIVPEPGEWTKEWYTQWKSPVEMRKTSRRCRSEDSSTQQGYEESSFADQGTYYTTTDNGSYSHNAGSFTDESTRRDATDLASFTDGSTVLPYTTDQGSFTDGNRDEDSSFFSGSGSDSESDGDSYLSSSSGGYDSWEEAPECGEIVNVRQKIGERVTRVHPDFTSSLRRSRWRKKYFPRGTFPY